MDEVGGMFPRWVRWLAGAAAITVASGCEGVDGSNPDAFGMRWWVSGSRTHAVQYVSPPWELSVEDGDELELLIPPEVFGASLEGSSSTHVFRLQPVDGPAFDEAIRKEMVDSDDPESGEVDPSAQDETGDLPEYLLDVDLQRPAEVALAELDYLVAEHDAQLDTGPSAFVTDDGVRGWTYQVLVAPGLFVRSFYVPGPDVVVRGLFVSIFDLDTSDIDAMAASIVVAPEKAQ